MDPLSLSASIIALLQLTSTVIDYLNEVRNASKEQREIAIEAGNLYGLLVRLRYRMDAAEDAQDVWFAQFKTLGSPSGPLDQLKESLEKLVGQSGIVRSERKRDRFTSSLQWHWNKSHAAEALQRIERLKSLITLALTDDLFSLTKAVHDQVKDISAIEVSTQAETLRTKILQWLAAPDPSSNYNAALQRRHPGTGTWLLEHPAFLHWKDHSSSSFLWLFGSAGCGKTFLCSTVLENMLQFQQASTRSIALCYFYFDFKDLGKQKCHSLLRSLIKQLSDQGNGSSLLQNMYMITCKEGALQPSEFMLRDLLQDLVKQFEHVYMVFDALDECTEVDSLLNLLQEFGSWHATSIVATSRRKKEIETQLSVAEGKIDLVSSLMYADIEAYVRYRVTADARLKKWNNAVQEEIISVLISKADGMFQWVFCQLEALAKCIKLTSLKRTLMSLPKTLDETYTRMFHDIEIAGYLEDATTSLQWLSFSLRPLDLSELVETLAIQSGEDGFFDPADRLPDHEDIKVICSNLVIHWDSVTASNQFVKVDADSSFVYDNPEIVNEDDNTNASSDALRSAPVRLAHFSVKEYLLSDRCLIKDSFNPPDCHCFMAESCLIYLKHMFDLGPLNEELVRSYPLTRYAVRYWFEHLRLSSTISDRILSMAVELLANPIFSLANAQIRGYGWRHNLMNSDFSMEACELDHPIIYAAAAGVPGLLDMMLRDDVCQSLKLVDLNLSLFEAAGSGTETDVRILLKAGAEIDAEIDFEGTPLSAAALGGRTKMVQLLLSAGAHVNMPSLSPQYRPLSRAAANGQGHIVQLLLDKGADLNSRCAALHNSLHVPSILKIIVKAGVDIDARSGYFGTPLQTAILYKHTATVRILIDAGADVNAADGQLGSAIETAVYTGNLEITRMLFDSGAVFRSLSSLLVVAARKGHLDHIPILLEHGADINGQYDTDTYGLALQEAASSNNDAMVRMFLKAGADVNIRSMPFGSALQAAVVDSEPILRQQASYIYEKRTKNEPAQTWLRIRFFQADVILTLTTRVVEKDIIVLSCLAFQPCKDSARQEIVKLLQTPEEAEPVRNELHVLQRVFSEIAAVFQEYFEKDLREIEKSRGGFWFPVREVCEPELLLLILCDLGADLDRDEYVVRDKWPESLTASSYPLVEALLDSGANTNVIGGPYGTVLQAASRNGNKKIVHLLLQRGAKINEEGGIFGSPLQAACATFREDIELVEILLAAGANVHASGGIYGNALQAACFQGFKNVVQLLLDKGADINMKGGRYGTALQAACASPDCCVDLVKLLLDAGADPSAEGGIFGSARNALLAKSYRPAMVYEDSDEEPLKGSDQVSAAESNSSNSL